MMHNNLRERIDPIFPQVPKNLVKCQAKSRFIDIHFRVGKKLWVNVWQVLDRNNRKTGIGKIDYCAKLAFQSAIGF